MGNVAGKEKSEKQDKILGGLIQIQDAKLNTNLQDYDGRAVFALVILKSEKFALLFNKNFGLIYLGEPNQCGLDDVVLAEVKFLAPNTCPDISVKFNKKFSINPSKLIHFTAEKLSVGPSWAQISHGDPAQWLEDDHQVSKFLESCLHAYGGSCVQIMAKKVSRIVELDFNPNLNTLLAIFSQGFDYLVWKDAGCAVVIYASDQGAILVDDKNGLIVCLYKEDYPRGRSPLKLGQSLYDVTFDFVHFRFVRLPEGCIVAMFEIDSLVICDEEGGFEQRIECLPITDDSIQGFLDNLDHSCLASDDVFVDAASKHLVRKDNLYHDGCVPTFRKRFKAILDEMRQQHRVNQSLTIAEEAAEDEHSIHDGLEVANEVVEPITVC